jgi:predicted tellurium resistance membrane protein TerC
MVLREETAPVEWLLNPDIWIALITLTALEIVLGVDNIIFISILAGKLPQAQQAAARRVGLLLAMITRILLLFSLSVIIKLTTPIVTVLGQEISGRDVILILGGLEGTEGEQSGRAAASFTGVIVQIMLLDIVFSLDSVITAVGMVDQLAVMVAAVIIAVGIMLVAAGPIAYFVNRHPTVKVLALSFLLLIGVSLLAEGFDQHIPKGYIYFSMGFAVLVEVLNLRVRSSHEGEPSAAPIKLREPYTEAEQPTGS